MKQFMAVAKALADENRVRTVLFLRDGEMCVCQVVEMLGLAPSTVSKHLNLLYQAALVESRKDGRWMYYRRPSRPTPAVKAALGWLEKALQDEPRIVQDTRRAKAVLKMDKEALCCRYKGGTD